jgi:hypothetical protein
MPQFVEAFEKALAEVLKTFPEAFAEDMCQLITAEEAKVYVPSIRLVFENSLLQFQSAASYRNKNGSVDGEWEKLNVLAIKNMRSMILGKAQAGTLGELEEVVLGGCELVMNECERLYNEAKEGESKNFI